MFEILSTIRIVDLTTIVAGPFATSMLGDLGADIIKVEPPDGDAYRSALPHRSPQMGAGFVNVNRNKRSVCLDLKDPTGFAAFLRLVSTADVLVHNIRPEPRARLGLTTETLREANPGLIICAAIGYGSDGPYGERPAYDDVIQAETGWSSMLKDADGAPRLAPTIVADKVAGLYVTQAILAALFNRSTTGEALDVEVPMFESLTAFTLVEHIAGRLFDPPIGEAGYNRLMTPNRRPHATKDGYVVVMPYSARHWVAFFTLVGRPDLADAPWVADPSERAARAHELYGLLGEFTPARTTEEWLKVLSAHDIPAAPVNSLDDLFDDPHLNAVDFFEQVDHPTEGSIVSPRHPVMYRSPTVPDRLAPRLGADTAAVLADAGLSADEIAGLLASGAART